LGYGKTAIDNFFKKIKQLALHKKAPDFSGALLLITFKDWIFLRLS
jgi:hypothetical protein